MGDYKYTLAGRVYDPVMDAENSSKGKFSDLFGSSVMSDEAAIEEAGRLLKIHLNFAKLGQEVKATLHENEGNRVVKDFDPVTKK